VKQALGRRDPRTQRQRILKERFQNVFRSNTPYLFNRRHVTIEVNCLDQRRGV